MMENPWQVDSIESFTYLKCPECVFDTKEKSCFQNHAIENHPLSHILFGQKGNNFTILDFDPNGFDSEYAESSKRAQFPKTKLHETSMLKEETLKIKNTFAETRDPLHEAILIEITNENELNVNQQTTVEKQLWCDTCGAAFLSDYSLKSHIESWHHYPQANKSDGNILSEVPLETLGNTVHEGKKLTVSLSAIKTQQTCEIDEKIKVKVLENFLLDMATEDEGMNSHSETYNISNKKEEFNFKTQTVIDHGDDLNKTPCETLNENVDEVKKLVPNPKCDKRLKKKKLRCKFCEWVGNKQTGMLQSDLEKHMLYIHHGKKPECTICNINFEKERLLIVHITNVHNTKLTYSCHICNAKIAQKDYVKRHIETVHEGKKPFKCDLCICTFRHPSALKVHIKGSHGSSRLKKKTIPWPCEICKKTFTSKGNLKLHITGVHEEKKFRCDICNVSFGFKDGLKQHYEAIHEGIKNYYCHLCDSSFYVKRGLFDHFEKYHEGNKPILTQVMKRLEDITTESNKVSGDSNFIIIDPLENDPSSIEIQLSKSPAFFQNSPTKTIQITKSIKEANETQQTCEIDEKIEFKALEEKSLNMAAKHKTYNEANNIEEFNFEKHPVTDHRGDVKKPPHETLDAIESRHHDNIENNINSQAKKSYGVILNEMPLETLGNNFEKLLKCKFCFVKTKSKADLESHILSIHGGKKPECTICHTTFWKEHHLKTHMKNAHNQKPSYSCHICGKKIADKDYMRRHIATVHEGTKPFKCSLCDSCFSTKQYVKKHIETVHGAPVEERKAWPCDVCKKEFTTKGALKTHITGAHEEKKFRCEICNVSFAFKQGMESHNKFLHEGIKNYNCNLCDSSFYQKQCLFEHFEKYHITYKRDLKDHEGLMPFNCNKCNSGYWKKHDLLRHFANDHEGKEKLDQKIEQSKEGTMPLGNGKFNLEKVNEMKVDKVSSQIKDQLNQKSHSKDLKKDHSDQNNDKFKPNKDKQDQTIDQFEQKIYDSKQLGTVTEQFNRRHMKSDSKDGKIPPEFDISSVNVDKKSDSTIEIHERKKSWPCTMCNKSFILQSNLMAHMDTQHDGVNLLGLIKQAFENVNSINEAVPDPTLQAIKKQIDAVHQEKKLSNILIKKQTKLVHGEKKLFKCSICKFSSELAIDLKRHMLSNHGGQRLFNCAICDDAFEQKIKLQKHIESVHGKKVPLDSL